jgi:hypothetical protein
MERDTKKELECRECGKDLSPEEIAHDSFNEGLNSLTGLASLTDLPLQHTLTLGLLYFVDQIYECAPSKEEAQEAILEIFNKVKERNNG